MSLCFRSAAIAPSLFLAALVAGMSIVSGCSERAFSEDRRPHVLLISIDTLRADHLGAYGGLVKTPCLDELARRSVVFLEAQAAAPTTLTSHTSLMTGTYPHRHGVPRNGFSVHPDNVMLAEILQAAGYRTAAFLGSFALSEQFGFDQGFELFDETFDQLVTPGQHDQNQRTADRVTDAAIEYAARRWSGPQFLFVHYFDPHSPYAPPKSLASRYAREGGPLSSSLADLERAASLHREAVLGRSLPPRSLVREGLGPELIASVERPPSPLDRDLMALYAGEVAFIDQEVGRLLRTLEESDWLEGALVIVTADHGESFTEHGDFWNHGLWVYQTTVHVPLILQVPGREQGRRVSGPVSLVDVVPTILDVLSLKTPQSVEGRSLIPFLDSGKVQAVPVFCEATQPFGGESTEGWRNAVKPRCVRSSNYKYVEWPQQSVRQLFDLANDPGEKNDLLRAPSAEHRERAEALSRLLQDWSRPSAPFASEIVRERAAEVRQRLEDLGYLEPDDEADEKRDGK